jgi:hypothetical protein
VVGALTVLMERMAELSEGFLPELLAAQPTFDVLDLIELSKWLKDFAGYWKAYKRRAMKTEPAIEAGKTVIKVPKSKPQPPWNGKIRWMGGNTATTPSGTVKIVEGERDYQAVLYVKGEDDVSCCGESHLVPIGRRPGRRAGPSALSAGVIGTSSIT